MARTLAELPIQGRIVIGAEEGSLAHGSVFGVGGWKVDLAVDPLEGRGIVARGGNGAMSMIAVGEAGSLVTLPDMYMRKMAVGPRARGKIDINRRSRERRVDRRGVRPPHERHHDDRARPAAAPRPRRGDPAAGARIKLIQDGDVTASISAAIRGTNDHLSVGIGGTRQAVMTAAALRCLGGELQAQLWPTTRARSSRRASRASRTSHVFTTEELAPARRSSRRPASRTATCCAASATSPTARARTRSSCARAATGCASSTASTSSAGQKREEVRLYGL
jgi:fructose-1,6-bisphosphatase II